MPLLPNFLSSGLSEGRHVANVVDGKDKPLKRLPSMSQADGRKLSEFDGVQSSIRRNDEVIRMCHRSLRKMLSVANAFKISDHQYNPC